jgi:virginiamycin B lyase
MFAYVPCVIVQQAASGGTDMPKRAFALLASAFCLAAAAPATVFPEGPGKQIVEERCGICHVVRHARSTDYGARGWPTLVQQMRNIGLPLTDDEYKTVVDYLVAINPMRERAPAKLIAGSAKVTMREWPVATPGAMPRDAAIAADGTVWFTGQFGGILISFDPRSQTLKEHKVRIPFSGPMGLAIDRAGDLWFTANRARYVGKFNPATGRFTEIRMPGPEPLDPSGLVIAPDGMIWFTAQNGNAVGRIDPTSGNLRIIPMPRPATVPFAIEADARGFIYAGERDGHRIARIDPNTLAITEFALAHPDSEPRRMAIGDNGVIWYTDIDRGYLGRLDPATGAAKEWPSPSGPISAPHGIAVIGDIVWYVESKALPNTLVRFDPRSETFQTFAIPSGYAIVRDLAVTANGDLAFAADVTNRIGIADIE